MGGEERREVMYEGFVNYRLNQGDSEAEAKAYACLLYTSGQALICGIAIACKGALDSVRSFSAHSFSWAAQDKEVMEKTPKELLPEMCIRDRAGRVSFCRRSG